MVMVVQQRGDDGGGGGRGAACGFQWPTWLAGDWCLGPTAPDRN